MHSFNGFYYNSRKRYANILRHGKADLAFAVAVAIIFCRMKVVAVNSLNIKSQFGASDIFNAVLSDKILCRYDSFQPIIQMHITFCRQSR